MELITKKDLLKNIPEKWEHQYRTFSMVPGNEWASEKTKKLKSEQNLTEERAIEIIGNDSWTRNQCDECKMDVKATIQLGEEFEFETSTTQICLDCLNKAVELIKINE